MHRCRHRCQGAIYLIAGAVLTTLVGCGDEETGPTLIPVSGKVTLDGRPLTTGGSVSYRDASGLIQPTGDIEPDGTYKLINDGREGAPAGEYQVIVFASEPRKETRGHGGLPRLIVHRKYRSPATTPLHVEVSEEAPAGKYDLAVTGIR